MGRARKTRNPHGSGSVYEKRPSEWVVVWRLGGGRRRYSKPFPTRALADALRAKVERDRILERAGLPPPPDSFPSFGAQGDLWLERRKLTHRSYVDDKSRWTKHVRPYFGSYKPSEIDAALIRKFVEAKRRNARGDGELDPATVGHCITLLSTIFTDLCERPAETGVSKNPVRTLPRSTRSLYKSTHRPQDTPFLRDLSVVPRLIEKLGDLFGAMYAVGLYAMLRPGEILGLHAEDVDLDRREIRVHQQVQDSKLGPLKDDESRIALIQNPLYPILAARMLKVGSRGLLFPTTQTRGGGKKRRPPRFINPHTLGEKWAEAARECRLPVTRDRDGEEVLMTFYQATRHTGASHWVMSGGNLATLSGLLGHSATWVTENYAHLIPGKYAPADYDRIGGVDSPMTPKPSRRHRENPANPTE